MIEKLKGVKIELPSKYNNDTQRRLFPDIYKKPDIDDIIKKVNEIIDHLNKSIENN